MQKLNSLYRYHYRNGDVYLFFTLNSDGRLDSFDIDRTKSVSDKTLIDIATTSLKRSSPFPKFPAGLSSPKISFNVVISFRDRKGP
jgi:outer membrane biosynthesis protein TonB